MSSAPAPRHHDPERPGELQPIAVFQPVHEGLGRLVVAGDGPRPVEDGRVGDGGGREERHAEIDREGRAEPLAEGALDQGEPAPAAGAKPVRLGRRAAAGDAGRRVEEVQRGAGEPAGDGERRAKGPVSSAGLVTARG